MKPQTIKSSVRQRLSSIIGRFLSLGASLALLLSMSIASAQGQNSYTKTRLVSDVPGRAQFTDPNLVNGWGIALGGVFWVSDNGTGVSTLYALDGTPQSLVVTIPPSSSNSEGISAPTGQVFNAGTGFVVSGGSGSGPAFFIFVSEDGGISGWNPSADPTHAILVIDHSPQDAVYKGAAISDTFDRLYVADFHNNRVEIYDQNFTEIDTSSTFLDPTLPSGYAPFGIQSINGLIYVAYAKQDASGEDDVPGPGHGFVSVFDMSGSFNKRLISNGPLNSPWGMALAPADFGFASGKLLVGNFGNGRINVFDADTGEGSGPVRNSKGLILTTDGLWGLSFADGALYVTAGPEDETHGLFAKISVNP